MFIKFHHHDSNTIHVFWWFKSGITDPKNGISPRQKILVWPHAEHEIWTGCQCGRVFLSIFFTIRKAGKYIWVMKFEPTTILPSQKALHCQIRYFFLNILLHCCIFRFSLKWILIIVFAYYQRRKPLAIITKHSILDVAGALDPPLIMPLRYLSELC